MEFERAAKHASELVLSMPKNSCIRVISHCDADGVASAAIMAISLARAGYGFHISIKKTGPSITDGMDNEENDLAIFCDIGSTNLEELERLKCRVILCDHHMAKGKMSNGINLNARLYGMNGSTEVCGATATFVLSLAMDSNNADLAQLAISGAIGDKQDKGGFTGYNKKILENAVEAGYIQMKEEVVFSQEKSLMDALEQSIEPYFTGFSGNGVIRFLQNLGIDPLKKIIELDEKEKKKLLSALTLKLVEQGAETVSLTRFVPYGKNYGNLYDLTSKLNACARENEESIGIALCLGNSQSIKKVEKIQARYRETIRHEIKELEKEKPGEMSHLSYFHTKKSPLNGVIAGLAMQYLPNFSKDKPVIALSVKDEKVDVSGRSSEKLVNEGFDLAEGMYTAANSVGGSGGGHPVAAGASILPGKEKEFLEGLNEVLKRKK
ncbi:MAG: DHH family phosphoesterase [Candidatus Thermoplasmatota archaeon]|nr:DHH family phosphoesterase [Candidatus Thermoplasmatota archaeon]